MKDIVHQRLEVISRYQLHHYQKYNDFFFFKKIQEMLDMVVVMFLIST